LDLGIGWILGLVIFAGKIPAAFSGLPAWRGLTDRALQRRSAMSITSISAIGGGYNYATSPYTPPPTSTSSITQLASGATITTIRGSTGDVLAVTTAITSAQNGSAQNTAAQNAAAQNAAAAQSLGNQDQSSTFYVTA
jgi:hypothetical protein